MHMKYAKNKRFNKDTIHPDPSLWKHKPNPILIERCLAIADYPHISKSFSHKDDAINYGEIEKYTKLFQSYLDVLTGGYLSEGSPLFVPKIVDNRLENPDRISSVYASFVQYLYEVQCALAEFYVYVNKYQFQFRKTMLPLMDKESLENIKPFMEAELKKSYGHDNAYTLENAYKLTLVYDLYLQLSYGLKISFEYLLSSNHSELSKDIEMAWLMCGYKNEMYSHYYKLLSMTSMRIFSEYDAKKSKLFPDIIDDIFQTLVSINGSYIQKNVDEISTKYDMNNLFQPSQRHQEEMILTFANERFPSRLLGSNAVMQLTSDFPNPMLVDSDIYSFELSVFSCLEDHRNLVAEFVMFGGIYNHIRDCVNYPLVFQMETHDVMGIDDNMNHFRDYIAAITHTLTMNYDHVLFENKNTALENQVKRRMSAQVRN